MVGVLKPREEAFARAVATGKLNQSAAYSECYEAASLSPAVIADRASRLAGKPEVQARIKVLTVGVTKAALKAAAYTLDVAIGEVDEIMSEARANKQAAAAVAAVKLKAQLAGHVIDRKEIKEIDPLKGATLEELGKLRDEITMRMLAAREAEVITQPTPLLKRAA